MQNEEIKITFDISEVSSKYMRHMQDVIFCVEQIYSAINNHSIEISKPLPTDNLPYRVRDDRQKPTFEEQKEKTINWVICKAFEEFINGLNKSFKETYKYLKTYSLYFEQPKNGSPIGNELIKIEQEIENLSISGFIEKIQILLDKKLKLVNEIKSINRIRNCLVHRHGIVGEKDIKFSRDDSLTLSWIYLKTWVIINGEEKELTFDLRKNGVVAESISFKKMKNKKSFKLGEKIILDINDINDIAYTCTDFVQQLYELMPIPKNK